VLVLLPPSETKHPGGDGAPLDLARLTPPELNPVRTEIAEALHKLADDPAAQVALVGDWNIAPENDDVWDMAAFAYSTHVSPPEREAFRAVVDAGYADVVRPYAPGPGVYTYWDYTKLRFPRREGMRIDFVLGSPALAGRVSGALIDREERKGKGASDHAPVIVDLGV
jgi:exodeoxyribonuclease III